MRQRSLAEQSPEPSTTLHPVLRAALNSLDVDLEEELARYRRLQGNSRDLNRSARNPFVDEARHYPTAAALGVGAAALPEGVPAPVPMPVSYRPLPPPGNLTAQAAPVPVAPEGLPSDNGDSDMPSDYLASSEELLRGLTDEEAALPGEPEPRLFDTLLTPLGIGSLLLLLLSSISFGYLIFNPQSLKLLGLEQLFNPGNASNSGAIAQSPDGTRPMAAPSPDLAAEEFPELNLDTLSALPPGGSSPVSESPSPAPTVQASPVPTVQTTPLSSPAAATPPATPRARAESSASRPAAPAAPRAQSTPRVAAAPVRPPVADPRPAASPVAAAPAASAAPAAPLYYVVVPYSGDRSLEQVRGVVGDAYVRNYPNGARVQAGAFSEASRARALVQELSQQGISAELIQPSN